MTFEHVDPLNTPSAEQRYGKCSKTKVMLIVLVEGYSSKEGNPANQVYSPKVDVDRCGAV